MALAPAQQVEAQTRAALEAKPATPPIGGSLKPEEVRANSIREQLAEEGERKATEGIAQPPLPRADERTKSIDERIGHKRDAAGKKDRAPGTPEEATFNKAKGADRLPTELYEKGYDRLSSTDKTAARNIAESSIREILPQNLADSILGTVSAPTAGKNAILENLLKDPKFREALRTKHTESLAKTMATTDETLNAAQRNFDEKDAASTKAGAKITKLNGELGKINTVIDGFDASKITVAGTDAQVLHELVTNTPAIEAEIQRLDLKVTSLDKIVTALRNAEANHTATTGNIAPAALRNELIKREGELEGAIKDLGDNRNKIAKRDALQAKLSDHQAQKASKEEEIEQAREGQEAAARERAIAEADLAHKKLSRGDEEADYIKGIEDSIRDAVSETVQTKLQEAQEAERKVLDKEAAETADADKKKILEGVRDQAITWDGKHHKLDKDAAKLIGARILNPTQGLDSYIEAWLLGNPPTTNPEELARIGEKMKDPTFMNEMRVKTGPVLIGRYIKAGGKLNEDDVNYLRSTEWGLKEELDKLVASGAIDKNFLQKLKGADNATWLKILLALVTTVALGAPALAGYF